MKEKIIKILKSHSYHHTEGVGVKSQFKYLAEVAFECCADEIMLALDQSQFTSDEAEEFINQEVERRIKERMLSDEDIIDFALLYVSHKSLLPANKGLIKDAIIIGMKEVRSRLTNPNNNPK